VPAAAISPDCQLCFIEKKHLNEDENLATFWDLSCNGDWGKSDGVKSWKYREKHL